LAPIFGKHAKQQPQSSKKSEPVLTEAEKKALEVRRAFLVSGVPEELKRQMSCTAVTEVDALPSVVWPIENHTQQKPAVATDTERLSGHLCNPWSLPSCDLRYRKLAIGNFAPAALLALGSFTSVLEKTRCHSAEVCVVY